MTKVKICGIKRLKDALLACEFGADAIGFVFYEKSPRYISEDKARKIIEKLPPFICKVGVFVNPEPSYLKKIIEETGINAIQLHGEESPYILEWIKLSVIKAIRIEKKKDLESLNYWKKASAILLEGKSKLGYGGVGAGFNHDLIKGLTERYRIIIAGGLNPKNVRNIILKLKPYGVDVSSGVEISPGIKDEKLMKEFIKNAKMEI